MKNGVVNFSFPTKGEDKEKTRILFPLKLFRAGWTVTDGSGTHSQILGNAIVRLIQHNRQVVAYTHLKSTIKKTGLKSTIEILKKHGKKNKV